MRFIYVIFQIPLGALQDGTGSFKAKKQRSDVRTEKEIPVSPKQEKRPSLKLHINLKELSSTRSSTNERVPLSPAATVRLKRLNLAKFKDKSFNNTR